MIGSAFIIHNGTWSCSNEVLLGMYSTPIFGDNNEITAIREEKTLTINGIFNPYKEPSIGDVCEMVLLVEKEGENKYAFIGNVRSISPLKTVINITGKSEKISEILRKIEIEN